MGSHHHHHHHHASKNIGIAFFLNLTFTILEIVGGLYVNSVAILSDAVHDLGDSFALGTAWYLERKSNQIADHKYTFGYKRFSVLSAFINCIILLVGSIIILWEAFQRLLHPEPVDAFGMMLIAVIGIFFNGLAAWKVMGGHSLNEQTISWHLLEDVMGWVVVLMGAIVMYFYPIYWLDAILSIGVAVFIAVNVIGNFKSAFFILAESVPAGLDLEAIKKEILVLPNVVGISQTHLWAINEDQFVFTTHVDTKKEGTNVIPSIKDILKKHKVNIVTVQVNIV